MSWPNCNLLNYSSPALRLVHRFVNNCTDRVGCGFECAGLKNAGVAGYAEDFRPVQSDSQTSEWYRYFENDVLLLMVTYLWQKI